MTDSRRATDSSRPERAGSSDDPLVALTRRVALLERRADLVAATDEVLEAALVGHLSLAETLDELFPVLRTHLGCARAEIEALDESLATRRFVLGEMPAPGPPARRISHPLRVAGEPFGSVDLDVSEPAAGEATALLAAFCEVLDNHLAAIVQLRHRHVVISELSDALAATVLGVGLDRALDIVRQHVDLDVLVLLYRHEDGDNGSLRYRILRRAPGETAGTGEPPVHGPSTSDEAFLFEHASELLAESDLTLPRHFRITSYRDEVMIRGGRDRRIIGRLIAGKNGRSFNSFDRDLLTRLAQFLEKRLLDFNREWKHLSACFAGDVVSRLLEQEEYAARYLAPREAEVAILYTDIAGFTRISEQVLKRPALIGQLINEWSQTAVEILWNEGGVFDKMVGDCVIGLFGPPFYELSAREICERAARAARAIRDYTRDFIRSSSIGELRGLDPPLGVATGLNYCPLFVGLFGPDEDFTGFSSGMNNTARLQGLAVRDEILCMESFVSALGNESVFSAPREGLVKNVAEPLRFRALAD